MNTDNLFKRERELAPKLDRIIEEMIGQERSSKKLLPTLIGSPTPFDISKPNEHDSKSEFLVERETVEQSLSSIDQLLSSLHPSEDQKQSGLVTVSFRVLEWNNRHQGEQLWHTNTMMNSNAKRCVLH